MTPFICATCGVQYAPADQPPASCPICLDERQYLRPSGQAWTTLQTLRQDHHNEIHSYEPGLTGIGIQPEWGIGQRPLLVETSWGNVLWDCSSLLDDVAIDHIRSRGGLSAIAISHPHFYGSCVEWSAAFGNIPVLIHSDDRDWMMRPDPAVVFWNGETYPVNADVTLIRCGGHFPGSTVLHWRTASDGRGALLTGDTVMVTPDRQHVSFMYSYPNLIPVNRPALQKILGAIAPFHYDRVYGGWTDRVISADAEAAVQRSYDRYLRAIADPQPSQ